jgi:hypothetical protein
VNERQARSILAVDRTSVRYRSRPDHANLRARLRERRNTAGSAMASSALQDDYYPVGCRTAFAIAEPTRLKSTRESIRHSVKEGTQAALSINPKVVNAFALLKTRSNSVRWLRHELIAPVVEL